MILPILTYPNPELKKKSLPVTNLNEELITLASDMAETMYAAPGVGLAAPQVGVHKRLIVIDISSDKEPPELITAVNPVIVQADGEVYEEEGCLSVPKYAANVRRHARVMVNYLNIKGEEVTLNAEGLLAIAFQHEIDHLEGILFIDHISPLKREFFRRKYRKYIEQQDERG